MPLLSGTGDSCAEMPHMPNLQVAAAAGLQMWTLIQSGTCPGNCLDTPPPIVLTHQLLANRSLSLNSIGGTCKKSCTASWGHRQQKASRGREGEVVEGARQPIRALTRLYSRPPFLPTIHRL